MPSNTPNNNPANVGYGQSQPLINIFNPPTLSAVDPGVNNRKPIGSIWVNRSSNAIWGLSSITNNSANWQLLTNAGGAGSFTSLTVTPGPISLTGTTSINTSGSGVTTIGTGGTGAVNIGNSSGNTAVTGSLTSSAGLTASTGNITATAGKVIAGTTLQANGDAAGAASTTSLSNVTATAAGAGTVTFAANAAGNINQTGWMKMYVGTTPVYIPYFDTI